MKILILGADGQLGSELVPILQEHELLTPNYGYSGELDITDSSKLNDYIENKKPDIIINAAAYTYVKDADAWGVHPAFNVNASAVSVLAQLCSKHNIKLIHISTNYVFDGCKKTPYEVDDIANPINNYGISKYAGELLIKASGLKNYLIIRTSALYAKAGYDDNFVNRAIDKIKNKEEFVVNSTETISPTSCKDLARGIKSILNTDKVGIIHMTCEGTCTWYELAKRIATILNLPSDNLKTNKSYRSNRPVYAVLKNSTNYLHTWEYALEEYLWEYK